MFLENRFIFFPTREFYYQPSDFGVDFEDVYFKAEDGAKLHGWHVPCPGAKSVMLFFHGNAGNLSDRADNVIRLHRAVGIDVFIIDYHGYGKSEGSPGEENLYRSARAAMARLRLKTEGTGKKIVLFGRSLGGAAAVHLAASEPCDGLIIESTFTSMPDMADALIPIFPARRVIKTRMDSINKIGRITVPKLIVHGENDSLVPFSHGVKLFEAAAPPKEFYPIPGADHNDTYLTAGDAYFERLAEFFRKIEAGSEPAEN